MTTEPNPFDDAKLIEIRKNQTDPIIQYYIVRTDVEMSTGKICAQIAHAAQLFTFRYQQLKQQLPAIHGGGSAFTKVKITDQWFENSFRKVVLKGTQKDFDKLKEELDVFVIKDAGLTEVDLGTETIVVTWPMYKSQQPKWLARLRVLS